MSLDNLQTTQNKKHATSNLHVAEKSSTHLTDNRPNSIIQKKQTEALKNYQPARTLQKKSDNMGLPDNLKSGIENLSGHSMDDIKVHYNSAKPAQLNAHAYAQGTDIYLAPGQEKHLPHEAWHVVQQKQGRVKPTVQMKGKVNVNDDKGLEKEADVMGTKALQKKAGKATTHGQTLAIINNKIIQRVSIEEDIDELRKIEEKSDDPLLSKILKEVLQTLHKKTSIPVHGFQNIQAIWSRKVSIAQIGSITLLWIPNTTRKMCSGSPFCSMKPFMHHQIPNMFLMKNKMHLR